MAPQHAFAYRGRNGRDAVLAVRSLRLSGPPPDRRARRGRGVTLDADLLAERRRELGLTQSDLAQLGTIARRTVAAAESGQAVDIPSAHRLTNALGLPYPAVVILAPEDIRRRLAAAGLAPCPPPTPWAARPHEVERLVTSLALRSDEPVVVVVSGPCGIGKSALAERVASQLAADFPDGVIWVPAGRNDPARLVEVQLDIADALGFRNRLPTAGRVAPSGFDHAFRAQLWRRRRLLVLDDVEDVSAIAHWASGERGLRVLVTTARRHVATGAQAPVIDVGPLDDESALALLCAHAGTERTAGAEDACRTIAHLLGGVPRSLQIAGRTLAREQLTRWSDLIDRLRTPLATAELTHALDAPPWHAADDPDATFAPSYRQIARRVSPTTWETFACLAVFGPLPFSLEWAAGAADLSEPETRRRLSELADLYLLRELPASPGDAGPHALVGLDAQAQRIARWALGNRLPAIEERLWAHAARRAALLRTRSSLEAFVTALRDRTMWRLCLDRLCRRVALAAAPGERPLPDVARSLAELPALDVPDDSPLLHLPSIVSGLDDWLHSAPLPEAGRWLTAALAVACARKDHAVVGILATTLNLHHVMVHSDFVAGMRWSEYACEALSHGEPERLVLALNYRSAAAYSQDGPAAAHPVSVRALELARRCSARTSAALAHLTGVVLLQYDELGDRWQQVRALMEESCRPLSASERDPPPPEVLTTYRLNLALLRRTLGETVRAHEVVHDLDATDRVVATDPLSRLVLCWIAELLDVSWRPAVPLPATAAEVLLDLAPELAPRRLLMLTMIIACCLRDRGAWPIEGLAPGVGSSGRTPLGPLVHLLWLSGFPAAATQRYTVLLLAPLDRFQRFFDAKGIELARAFVRHSAPPDHPCLALVERLAATHYNVSRSTHSG